MTDRIQQAPHHVVVFDLGGTVLDAAAPEFELLTDDSFSHFAAADLMRHTRELFADLMAESTATEPTQRSVEEVYRAYSERTGCDIPRVDIEECAWRMIGGPRTRYLTPLPHAVAALEACRLDGVGLVAMSNTALPSSLLERILSVHGLANAFDAVVLSSEIGWRKPSENLVRCVETLYPHLHPSRFMMVGDDAALDLMPCARRGWATVLVGEAEPLVTLGDETPRVASTEEAVVHVRSFVGAAVRQQ